MHDHHVTYLAPDAPAVWGDMFVFSQGVQIVFDSPFVNSRNLSKSGFLIYEDEILKAVAICRTVLGLTEQELGEREKQIARSVHPNLWRRIGRSMSNLLNVVRDAIVNTLGLLVGRLGGRGQLGAAAKTQTGKISEVGSTLLGVIANAYEPLLERHIGKPVILEILYPAGSPRPSGEFEGYLADYNEKFIACSTRITSPRRALKSRWRKPPNWTVAPWKSPIIR